MTRYAMVIDLDRCIGCHGCTTACRQEHATPSGVRWTRVTQMDVGSYPKVRRAFVPHGCMHCAEPSCVSVCPSGASFKTTDGLVLVDHSRCIGCKACMVACPYDARHLLERVVGYFNGHETPYERSVSSGHQKGTVEKCNLCVDRLGQGLGPACIDTCPTNARHFGDLDDPEAHVARLVKGPRAARPSTILGTQPSVYYLMPYTRRAYQEGSVGTHEMNLDDGQVLFSGLGGSNAQPQWGWLVAAYLALLAAGAGSYVASLLARILDPSLGTTARPGIALGLAFVVLACVAILLDLGRPERFYLAALRPLSSWESRGFLLLSAFAVLAGLQLVGWLIGFGAWDIVTSTLLSVLGLGLLLYEGILLASFRLFPLWTNPLQIGVFLTSGLLAGCATLLLDPAGSLSIGQVRLISACFVPLSIVEAGLLAALMVRVRDAGPAGLASIRALTSGRGTTHFWLGVVAIGLAIPFAFGIAASQGLFGPVPARVAALCVLAGLLFHRYTVLASGRRPNALSFSSLGYPANGSA